MATYLIKDFIEKRGVHVLETLTGDKINVDLFVDSSFQDSPITEGMHFIDYIDACHKLVGKQVEIETLYTVEFIASQVKISNHAL